MGEGIDVGGGNESLNLYQDYYPRMKGCRNWDLKDGDAQFMQTIPTDHFDFLHSSHCLEHLNDPYEGFANWLRIVKPGGYLVIAVPDEDMYEQGYYPSQYNLYHQWTFTIAKKQSWSPRSINLLDLLNRHSDHLKIIKIELLDHYYSYETREQAWVPCPPDQTMNRAAESGIEFIVQKEPCPATILNLRKPVATNPSKS